jgi:hypothetical protein
MRAIVRALVVVSGFALAGCGSSNRVQVQGVLLRGGSPLRPPEGASNQVVFVAMEVKGDSGKSIGANEPFAAVVNEEDGTFEVPGPDGRGIPPGKYRVSVTQKYRTKHTVEKPKMRGAAPIDRDTDLLGDRYGPTSSPIVVEVTTPEKLTIDLDRPTGSPSR